MKVNVISGLSQIIADYNKVTLLKHICVTVMPMQISNTSTKVTTFPDIRCT